MMLKRRIEALGFASASRPLDVSQQKQEQDPAQSIGLKLKRSRRGPVLARAGEDATRNGTHEAIALSLPHGIPSIMAPQRDCVLNDQKAG